MFSFKGERKIKNGTSKYFLREAMKNELPNEIYLRKDKKGFETPINEWLFKLRPQMIKEILESNYTFIKSDALKNFNSNSPFLNKLLFRLFVFSRWQKQFSVL